jgi:hypothetical protein
LIARAVDEAAAKLRDRRRRALEAAALGAGSGLVAGGALDGSPRLTVALLAGAGFEVLVLVWAMVSRRCLIATLAVEPDAYSIPEVEAYGQGLTKLRQRRILAEGIRSMVKDAFRPGSLYLGDRVARYARDLEAVARDLLSPAVRVHPVSIARCRRLLTEGSESPLYNPNVPEEELDGILRRIRAGMQREIDAGA